MTSPSPELVQNQPNRLVRGVAIVAASLAFSGLIAHEIAQENAIDDAQTELTAARKALSDQQSSHDDDIEQIEDELQRAKRIEAIRADQDPSMIDDSWLVSPEELPGVDSETSYEQQNLLANSTVKILKRLKTSTPDVAWEELCTGNKVSYGGKVYIRSAAHCFVKSPAVQKGGAADDDTAYDLTPILDYEYAIVDPTDYLATRANNPLATVGNVAVDYSYSDSALMTLASTSPEFEALQTLQLDTQTVDPMIGPVVGQEAFMVGAPESSGNTEIYAKGQYLGLFPGSDTNTIPYHIVGLKDIYEPSEDVCNYGSSGSTSMLSDDTVLGVLTQRNNITFNLEGTPPNDPDNPQGSLTRRMDYEKAMGIRMDQFSTLCLYSVISPAVMAGLVNSIGNPDRTAHPIPAYK